MAQLASLIPHYIGPAQPGPIANGRTDEKMKTPVGIKQILGFDEVAEGRKSSHRGEKLASYTISANVADLRDYPSADLYSGKTMYSPSRSSMPFRTRSGKGGILEIQCRSKVKSRLNERQGEISTQRNDDACNPGDGSGHTESAISRCWTLMPAAG